MEWFNGNIADAVKLSKERNVIFVVFIDGSNGGESTSNTDSAAMNQLLNNSEIISKLNNPDRYLAIRIESQDPAYKQFAQIYRLVPVPSIFFIGQFGEPIEIVTATIKTVDALKERIEVAEGIFYGNPNAPTPNAPSNDAASGSTSSVSLDEKLAAANKRIEKKRIEREEEEKKVQKERELERRKAGKDMAKLKQWQDDQELKQLKEDRAREKAEEEEARRRVLEQIKMDRLQRQQRLDQPAAAPTKPTNVETPRPMANLPDHTRIQFRKPTGESIVDSFKSDGYFGDVWKYAKASVVEGSQNFVLATAMPPRREYSEADSEKTLIELNLAPSAVLLVIPLSAPSKFGGSTSASGAGTLAVFSSFLLTIFWSIATPLLNLWRRFAGSNDNSRSNNSRPEEPPREDAGPSLSSQNISREISQKRNLARYNLGPSPAKEERPVDPKAPGKKPESNVHRLRDYDSDDNENNTYNGNSTQQM